MQVSVGPHVARIVLVGDVHGCIDELRRLLVACAYDPEADVVVLLGDLVAKGPGSADVVSLAKDMGWLAVRGNHDDYVVRHWHARRDGREPDADLVVDSEHARLAVELDTDSLAFLDALPLVLVLDTEPAIVCAHAGVDSSRALDAQDGAFCMTTRTGGDRFIPPSDGATLFYGHNATKGHVRTAHAEGLDSGCCYGGFLSAVVIERGKDGDGRAFDVAGRRLVQERAARQYAPPSAPLAYLDAAT